MAEQSKCKKTPHRKAPGQAELVRERNARLRRERHLLRMAKKASKLQNQWDSDEYDPDYLPPRTWIPKHNEAVWNGWLRDQRRRAKQIEWAEKNGLRHTVSRFVAHCVLVK